MSRISDNAVSVSFDFACLSYVAPGQNRFAWKLEGLNNEWIETDQHSVSFMKLSPKKYTFKVRSCNNNGYWDETGQEFTFRIMPSPFMSIWAKAGYVILCISALYILLRYFYLRQEEKKEKELYRAKIDFFTQIAHEIKTPVTLIKAPLEQVIRTGRWNLNVAANLTVISKNVDRLMELIRQLLDFRKIDAEGYRLTCSLTDVSNLVQETVSRFRNSAADTAAGSGNRIEITVNTAPGHISIISDREALTKILSNLLANAMKFAASKVSISLSGTEEGVRLCVEDDGPGIPDNIRDRVFEPFFQGGTYSGNGVGIGLSLVKLLVEKLSGKVRIGESDAGGCAVTVEIPDLAPGYINSVDTDYDMPDETDNQSSEEKKSTLMIVEDTVDMREFLIKNFEESYRVISANDGEEALATLSKQPCDIIISDILMPGMDGFELLAKVREDRMLSHIPFIILSALDSSESKIRGLEKGADAYIEKPFSLNYLKATVESILENRKRIFEHFASGKEIQYGRDELAPADRIWLENVNRIIIDNMEDENFSLDMLEAKFSMSHSNFHRKIKGLTGMSGLEYIKLIRLKTAAQLLKSGYKATEVCFMTGFSSTSWFSKCFLKQFGVSPREFAKDSGRDETV